MFASLATGRESVKSLIKALEDEFKSAQFLLNEPGAVKHRTKIPLGVWEDVYVTNLQGDLAKDVADQVGTYTQASFVGTFHFMFLIFSEIELKDAVLERCVEREVEEPLRHHQECRRVLPQDLLWLLLISFFD